MEVIKEYKLTEQDYQLLGSDVGTKKPCITKCGSSGIGCLGCDDYRKYNRFIKLLEDNNLTEIYNKIHSVKSSIQKIENEKAEIRSCMEYLNGIKGLDLEKVGLGSVNVDTDDKVAKSYEQKREGEK